MKPISKRHSPALQDKPPQPTLPGVSAAPQNLQPNDTPPTHTQANGGPSKRPRLDINRQQPTINQSMSASSEPQQLKKRPTWSAVDRPRSPQNVVLAPRGNPGGVSKTDVDLACGGSTKHNSNSTEPRHLKYNRILSSFGVKVLQQLNEPDRSSSVRSEIQKYLEAHPIQDEMSENDIINYVIDTYESSETVKERVGSSFLRALNDVNRNQMQRTVAVAMLKGFCRSLGSYVLGGIFESIPELERRSPDPVKRAIHRT